jgi:hydroxymethylglutaryl-CoA lyase
VNTRTAGWPRTVRVVEVGPRDGLQNQSLVLPAEVKLEYIRLLAAAGCREIEATAFVHPARVPQLADAEAVAAGLAGIAGPRFSALVPNERGLQRALAARIRRVAVFTAASNAFTQRNIGMTVEESLRAFRPLVRRALAAGVSVRGYVSTCVSCPYSGPTPPEAVARAAEALLEMGADEVSLGDTVGVAVPTDVWRLLEALPSSVPLARVAGHFHDTSGTALANVLAALEAGVSVFDSASGGLGGCPFAPGAAGNLATEDLVYLLEGMGIETGIDLQALAAASRYLETHLDQPLPSRQYQRLRSLQPGS